MREYMRTRRTEHGGECVVERKMELTFVKLDRIIAPFERLGWLAPAPRPHPQNGKGSGDIGHFCCAELANSTYANTGADLGEGGGGGLGGCNLPKVLETNRKQCAGVKIYSAVPAQSTVQPEREKKAGVPSARCRGATLSQSIRSERRWDRITCVYVNRQ